MLSTIERFPSSACGTFSRKREKGFIVGISN
jgi:hypothetical protein